MAVGAITKKAVGCNNSAALLFYFKNKFGEIRNTPYLSEMKGKKEEKRVVKSYKIRESVYQAAQKIALRNETTVANMVENFLIIKTKKHDYRTVKKV